MNPADPKHAKKIADRPVGPAGWLSLGVSALSVIGLYFWITHPAVSQLTAYRPAEAYYNLLVDGFRAGQLSLKTTPPPELVRLPDPYDPARNAPYRLHDTSYFRGKYYLYFGVTPALLLFWPYVTLTGHYLWHKQAVMIFCAGGFLASAGIFLAIRRRYFPEVGPGIPLAGTLALGLATAAPVMMRRPDVWEVPISCGYLLVMASLAALWCSLHSARRPAGWLALASALYGLAVGARPSLLLGAAGLLVPPMLAWFRAGVAVWGQAAWWRLWAAILGPMLLIGLGLALYNYRRFGSPWEFGQTYQLAQESQIHARHFDRRFLWFNFRIYFLEPVRLSSYFPFVLGADVPPAPDGQFGVENVSGILTNMPLAWLALAAPLAWRHREPAEKATLRGFVVAVSLVFFLSALAICLFGGAGQRYEVDFVPALILLAVIGILGIERALASRPGWRGLARAGWALLLAWSIGFNFFASCGQGDLLRTQDPHDYRVLARWFDYPAYWLERLRGAAPGPLEIKFRLPPFKATGNEPLVVTGTGPRADYLFINYADAQHVIIGLEHTGYGGPRSAPIPVNYADEHTLVVEMGSLYPPVEHPYFSAIDGYETVARTQQLLVRLDGRVVLERLLPFYESSPQTRHLGTNPFAQNLGHAFTGEIVAHRTVPPPALVSAQQMGRVDLRLLIPAGKASPQGEPLVVTGVTGRGDIVYLRRLGGGRVTFGYDHWGRGGPESEPQAINFEEEHELTVQMGSLYPAGPTLTTGDPDHRVLKVTLDGREILSGQFDFYSATPTEIYLGRNPIGGSTTSTQFDGVFTNQRQDHARVEERR